MSVANDTSEVKLKRVPSLSDLVIYGIILIQPVAALPLFGRANNISQGHAVTTILVAMVAMIFTAISYGRMANRYPEAGSAYTYVGKGINPYLGFCCRLVDVSGLHVHTYSMRYLYQYCSKPFVALHPLLFLDTLFLQGFLP